MLGSRFVKPFGLAAAAGLGLVGSAQAVTFEITGSTTYDWYGNGDVFQIQVNTDTNSVSTVSSTFVPNSLGDAGDQTGLPLYGMARDPVTGKLYGGPARNGGPIFDANPGEVPLTGKIVEIHPQPPGTNWTWTNLGSPTPTGPGTSAGNAVRTMRGMTFNNDGSKLYFVNQLQTSTGSLVTPPADGVNLFSMDASELASPPMTATLIGPTNVDYQEFGMDNSRFQAIAFNAAGELFALTPDTDFSTFLVQIDPATGAQVANYGPIQGTGSFVDPDSGDTTILGWCRGLVFGPDGRLYTVFNPGNDGIAGSEGNSITPARLAVLDLSNGAWDFSDGDPGVPMSLLSGNAAPIAIFNLTIGAAVPEPGTIMLLVSSAGLLLCRRRPA
jgi:hypothetical protein